MQNISKTLNPAFTCSNKNEKKSTNGANKFNDSNVKEESLSYVPTTKDETMDSKPNTLAIHVFSKSATPTANVQNEKLLNQLIEIHDNLRKKLATSDEQKLTSQFQEGQLLFIEQRNKEIILYLNHESDNKSKQCGIYSGKEVNLLKRNDHSSGVGSTIIKKTAAHGPKLSQDEQDEATIRLHANKGCINKQQYLWSQAPTKAGIGSYWATLVHNNVESTIDLTNHLDISAQKSITYYPIILQQKTEYKMAIGYDEKKGTVEYGKKVYVELKSIRPLSNNITMNTYCVTYEKIEHTITRYHYTEWSDQGAPDSNDIVKLCEIIDKHNLIKPSSPLHIHCSAGIGRTGTITVFNALYRLQVKENQTPTTTDMDNYIFEGRIQRDSHFVQTITQFKFIHDSFFGSSAINFQQYLQKDPSLATLRAQNDSPPPRPRRQPTTEDCTSSTPPVPPRDYPPALPPETILQSQNRAYRVDNRCRYKRNLSLNHENEINTKNRATFTQQASPQ